LAKKISNMGKPFIDDPWYSGTVENVFIGCCFAVKFDTEPPIGGALEVGNMPDRVMYCPDREFDTVVPIGSLPDNCQHHCVPMDEGPQVDTEATGRRLSHLGSNLLAPRAADLQLPEKTQLGVELVAPIRIVETVLI